MFNVEDLFVTCTESQAWKVFNLLHEDVPLSEIATAIWLILQDDSITRAEVLIALEEANGNTQISNDQNTAKEE